MYNPPPGFSFGKPSPAPPPPDLTNLAFDLANDLAALHPAISTLGNELKTTNTHLATCVARLKTERAPPTTPATTTFPHTPGGNPRTIASGRGAASLEVFKEMIKTNWHGRLGRTHMVDVDALSTTALTELDCLIRRKLNEIFPRGGSYILPDADTIFASLAALGLRLEDRGAYADLLVEDDQSVLLSSATTRRGRNMATHLYSKSQYRDYWQGFALETLVELAGYRGLFDDEGFLKV